MTEITRTNTQRGPMDKVGNKQDGWKRKEERWKS